ncbi:MAG TPA: TIGR02611 family protein [Actinophytocola sp.]|uniref:TIGR02611 family protein n=1 Tax=Actinophytocola sp. TaxID=1872138 RepID=UPI002DB7988F|nr:TIGR02611 family protein [Actinophytocola sp.]HEU5472888.1 TIGR02611 family protein [Actinophytocola sp.]
MGNADVENATTERPRHRKRRPRWATRSPGMLALYRVSVAALGGLVLIVGIVLIPYPGPGWLIVFAGLAILATEFHWAHRALTFARGRYTAWTHWLRRQHVLVRLTMYALTCLVVLTTLYLLGVFGLVGGWLGIDWPWLDSPFFG